MVANRPPESDQRGAKRRLPSRLDRHVVRLGTVEQAPVWSEVATCGRVGQQVGGEMGETLLGVLPGVGRDCP